MLIAFSILVTWLRRTPLHATFCELYCAPYLNLLSQYWSFDHTPSLFFTVLSVSMWMFLAPLRIISSKWYVKKIDYLACSPFHDCILSLVDDRIHRTLILHNTATWVLISKLHFITIASKGLQKPQAH